MQKYNWNAHDYEKHSKAQQKWARELITKLKLNETEDILDLGCGEGKVTAEIANDVPNGSVVGVDNSASMIKLAAEQYPKSKYPNLSFLLMDAAQLSFNEQFDVVFSNAALHWVRDHKPVIKGLYNCLRPTGRILLQMGGRGNAASILTVLDQLQKQKEWQRYFEDFQFPYGFYGPDEYRQWLTEAGFTVKRVELVAKDMEHNGQSGLEGWIRTTWLPYTGLIPQEKREQFIIELAENYLHNVPLDSRGKAHVAMMRLEVEAAKR